ncbi:hypothetical protein COW36_03285 [bacterium (Candidatus Blackallbacteria) CG17_big_fil_post_rev_8_21_14_2_50_48_46]|uniref:HEAT repeat domain-containing protein n=1 Tax=bacterium (Candidatus Blackallbacteria) CG17_big_fil_post_rev_8_21_14_2_50_48_46 TaxID=2014261 RepID=A0A2M7G9L7_9BACT|nr:MAG: hypothetical protein COW64_05525 [bacterium (Candidatus Blackallbacteria) CG18_big_fil_WC_8_21_14_2_50_49_26]PIW18814.1 MAG: hypothetical protein COW36_03285 [bacterium (Candidatus Blackallbacteria) CG17_big_fil_post_rev_8_21_14_2_50_48_46]PIW49269.1 MAG: hypothetical protein COW20_06435 [bacterium (Candidatus Blackallbacteria) CG13_big_fil_rev_8_21_14_2_50_49_14]
MNFNCPDTSILFESPDPEIRRRLLLRLSEQGSPDAIPVLVAYLKQESNAELRELAAQLLKALSAPEKLKSRRDPYGIFRI